MSLRLSTMFVSILVVFSVLLNLTFSFPFGLQKLRDDGNDFKADSSNWNNVEMGAVVPDKKDCAGFPCMYTHMAEKAGRASLYRTLARIIDDCVANPMCNPGKRRKRSNDVILQ